MRISLLHLLTTVLALNESAGTSALPPLLREVRTQAEVVQPS
jgi:hypothetical protein